MFSKTKRDDKNSLRSASEGCFFAKLKMLCDTFCFQSYVNGLVGEQMVEVRNPRIQTFPFFPLTPTSSYSHAFPVISQIANISHIKTLPRTSTYKSKTGVFGLDGTDDSL